MNQTLILAQAAGSNPLSTVAFFGAIFAIMYFLMIRPQQKQARDHKTFLASLKKGDEVITQGGLLGRVYAMADKIVTLEIANGVKVRVLLTSVQGKGGGEAEAAPLSARAQEAKDVKKEDP